MFSLRRLGPKMICIIENKPNLLENVKVWMITFLEHRINLIQRLILADVKSVSSRLIQ